jgi:hypothetical protein
VITSVGGEKNKKRVEKENIVFVRRRKVYFCCHRRRRHISSLPQRGRCPEGADEESTSCIASSDSVLHENVTKEELAIACTERCYTMQTLLSSSTTAVVPLPRWGRLLNA